MTRETYTGTSRSEEDQATEVGSTLVAESTSGIDQSTNTIGLETGTDERRAPRSGSSSGLAGLEELILGVSGLRTLIGVTEERGEDGGGGGLGEEDAEGNRRGLDGREIWILLVVLLMKFASPTELVELS